MVELRHVDDLTLAIGFAGDTYNTAVYVARTSVDISVDYVTIVGDDRYSAQMLAAIRAEGIGTSRVTQAPGRSPGLYLVRTDSDGERHFTYHRSQSPARDLFAEDEPDLTSYDMVYLSAITLQIMTAAARTRLWAALDAVRARGGRVAFDSNYRATGWSDLATARSAIEATLARTDIALPTFSDEQLVYGDADVRSCIARLAALGVAEIVVKDGASGCVTWLDGESTQVPARVVPAVVDTTAAGDSFNGAYLSARLTGASAVDAAHAGHALAALVITQPGAILPPYLLPRRA